MLVIIINFVVVTVDTRLYTLSHTHTHTHSYFNFVLSFLFVLTLCRIKVIIKSHSMSCFQNDL